MSSQRIRASEAHVLATRRSLSKGHVFAQCSDKFLDVLADQVLHEIIQPGVDIVKEGDQGDRMYILSRGEVDVIIGGSVMSTLGDGSIFGEMAALCENRPLAKRTATVRSKTLCDCRVASRKVVLQTVQRFPKDAEVIQKEVDRRMTDLHIKGNFQSKRSWQPLPVRPSGDGRSKSTAGASVLNTGRLTSKQTHRYEPPRAAERSGESGFDPSSEQDSLPESREKVRFQEASAVDLVQVGGLIGEPHRGRGSYNDPGSLNPAPRASCLTSDVLLALALPGIALARAQQNQAHQAASTCREFLPPEADARVSQPKPMSARSKAHPLGKDMVLPAGGTLVRATKKGAALAQLAATRVSSAVPQMRRAVDTGTSQLQKPTVCSKSSSTRVWQQLERSQATPWHRVVPKARDIPSQEVFHETETLWQRHQNDRAARLLQAHLIT